MQVGVTNSRIQFEKLQAYNPQEILGVTKAGYNLRSHKPTPPPLPANPTPNARANQTRKSCYLRRNEELSPNDLFGFGHDSHFAFQMLKI